MDTSNHIYILGAGAIGKVLACLLRLQGKSVVLLRGSVHNAAPVLETIEVETTEGLVSAAVEVSTLEQVPVLDGLVVITSKSYGNEGLADRLQPKATTSPLVLLQNGLNIEQPFLDRGFRQLYRCVLFATSQPLSENRFRFRPAGQSLIGCLNGEPESLPTVVDRLNSPCFPFSASADLQPVVWTKAIVNSVFNSVCPLLETDNGIFYRNEDALHLAKGIIDECLVVASASGVTLSTADVADRLLTISRMTEGQSISTSLDLQHKRQTEIDTLNLAIAGMAKTLNLEAAVSQTRLLGELIRLKSAITRSGLPK